MNILKKKEQGVPNGALPKGFTLVEMLIVMFIIAVLSTLAINGYTEYRRTALLGFAADSFTAQFYGLRDSTMHGDFGSVEYEKILEAVEDETLEYEPSLDPNYDPDVASCFGYYLRTDGGDYSIQKFKISYSNKLEYDLVSEDWSRKGCEYNELYDLALTETVFSDLGLDEDISVVGIYDENGVDLSENIAITFIPPNGEIYIDSGVSDPKEVRIEIKYGKSEEDKYKRNIFIDLASGQVNVTRANYAETPA